jgi:hypothetical protein
LGKGPQQLNILLHQVDSKVKIKQDSQNCLKTETENIAQRDGKLCAVEGGRPRAEP